MKTCIWCRRSEPDQTFGQRAQIFPKALDGINICMNVCDECNHYFGSPQSKSPAIDVVLKELFNISKYAVFYEELTGKGKKRFKSQFFNVNWNSKTISIKPSFRLTRNFQEKIIRLFKRGIYKVYLEERENQKKDALDDRFNFIRNFSRYDLNDYSIFYLKPQKKVIYAALPDFVKPIIRFTELSEKFDKDFRIYEYQIVGHHICIPTSAIFDDFYLDSFRNYIKSTNYPGGTEIIQVKSLTDIDFTFRCLNQK